MIEKKFGVCTYCGTGCDIVATVLDNTIQDISAVENGCVSEGRLCIKGKYGFNYLNSPNRLTRARISKKYIEKNRDLFPTEISKKLFLLYSVDENFYECDYDIGYKLASWSLQRVINNYSNEHIAFIGGARTSNENAYFFQKFAREYIKSPHIDNCARICHAPSLGGLRRSIGEGASTNPFDDIYKAEYILLIGTNTTEAHPIVANRVIKATNKDLQISVMDIRETKIMKFAKNKLVIPYETNLLVLNMIARVILEEGLYNKEFIFKRCKNFDEYKRSILDDKSLDYRIFENIEGYEDLAKSIPQVARDYATKRSLVLWGLGVTEHIDGSDSVSAICNLALLTGNIGKDGAGLMPLRGQNNVQGACDMGCLPYFGLGYSTPEKIGHMTPVLLEDMIVGKIKALYNLGEDIAHVHANINKVNRALDSLELIIVNEIFPNEITKKADIIFGVKSAYEKTGIYTNAERRMKISEPLQECEMPDDWEVLQKIANELGIESNYKNSEEIWDEVRERSPQRYALASYQNFIDKAHLGLQWPVNGEDVTILHREKFKTVDGLGNFIYKKWKSRGHFIKLQNSIKDQYFYLSTGRIIEHYNNSVQTRECPQLFGRHENDFIFISKEDSSILDLNGEYIIISKYGETKPLKIKVKNGIKKGTLFTTFHHPKSHINYLFGDECDELVMTARFKSVKVKLEQI